MCRRVIPAACTLSLASSLRLDHMYKYGLRMLSLFFLNPCVFACAVAGVQSTAVAAGSATLVTRHHQTPSMGIRKRRRQGTTSPFILTLLLNGRSTASCSHVPSRAIARVMHAQARWCAPRTHTHTHPTHRKIEREQQWASNAARFELQNQRFSTCRCCCFVCVCVCAPRSFTDINVGPTQLPENRDQERERDERNAWSDYIAAVVATLA
jgi:hypothetical protein